MKVLKWSSSWTSSTTTRWTRRTGTGRRHHVDGKGRANVGVRLFGQTTMTTCRDEWRRKSTKCCRQKWQVRHWNWNLSFKARRRVDKRSCRRKSLTLTTIVFDCRQILLRCLPNLRHRRNWGWKYRWRTKLLPWVTILPMILSTKVSTATASKIVSTTAVRRSLRESPNSSPTDRLESKVIFDVGMLHSREHSTW